MKAQNIKSSKNSAGKKPQEWALITGASAGIGAATAEALASAGYSLILLARRKNKLESLKTKICKKNSKVQVEIITADIQSWTEVQKKLEACNEMKNVSVLVNNAGLARGADSLQAGHVNDWNEMIDTNVKGLLHSTKVVLPFMIRQNRGHIFNLGSVAGRWVYPGGAVYCATKAAVGAITEGLRMDLFGHQIRVTNISPGMVETDFSKVRFKDNDKAAAVYAGMKPLTAENIAETILWVLKQPPHVNVQELVVYPTEQAAVRMISRSNG